MFYRQTKTYTYKKKDCHLSTNMSKRVSIELPYFSYGRRLQIESIFWPFFCVQVPWQCAKEHPHSETWKKNARVKGDLKGEERGPERLTTNVHRQVYQTSLIDGADVLGMITAIVLLTELHRGKKCYPRCPKGGILSRKMLVLQGAITYI